MSKDLKKEYEEMLDAQIPDLWSRIEPNLHEKTNVVSNETFPQVQPVSFEQYRSNTVVSKKKLSPRTMSMIISAAAACLCLAIAIPVMVRQSGTKKSSNIESNKNFAMAETTTTSQETATNQSIYQGSMESTATAESDSMEESYYVENSETTNGTESETACEEATSEDVGTRQEGEGITAENTQKGEKVEAENAQKYLDTCMEYYEAAKLSGDIVDEITGEFEVYEGSLPNVGTYYEITGGYEAGMDCVVVIFHTPGDDLIGPLTFYMADPETIIGLGYRE